MLYCERCGQCIHISDDQFIEYAQISGSSTRYLNPRTGEVEDYGDDNTESNGDSEYECPHCGHNDINFDWEGSAEDSFDTRGEYEKERREQAERQKQEELKETIKDSEWDLENNSVHK
jgi:L-lactate utilization protein LutB